MERTWIKMVGFPLHLWSAKAFKALLVTTAVGGLKMEEEAELRNHLKWADYRRW